MTVVNPKSISGITSITTASGSDNLLTIHTSDANNTERLRIDSTGATKIVTGIVTTLTATTGIVTTLTANTVTANTTAKVGTGITLSPDGDIFATGVTTSTTVQVGSATTIHTTGIDLGDGNLTGHNLHSTGITTSSSVIVGGGVTISESGIEASGIGITVANINGGKVGGRKNLMINGSMIISQRYRTAAITNVTGYVIDRFTISQNGTEESPTKQQVGITTGSAPWKLGFGKALKITNGNQTGGAGGGDYIFIRYNWEGQEIVTSGWDYIDPKSFITLSFWIKSSVAQSFQMYFRSRNGTNYQYPFETGSLTADTWTKVIKTIPGNSNLVFDHNNLIGMYLDIGPFFGTNFTNNAVTNDAWSAFHTSNRMKDYDSTWYTTNDATFEVTGFQLEVGTQATPFEHRSESEELALCQRYCYALNLNNGDNTGIFGHCFNDTTMRGMVHFPVPMRDLPTYTGSSTICRVEAANSSPDFDLSEITVHREPLSRPVPYIGMTVITSSITAGQGCMVVMRNNGGRMIFDAEVG